MQLVRPEHCGGLAVKARYLRGLARKKEMMLKSLDPANAAIICVEIVFSNKRTDSMSLRRVKILPRKSQNGPVFTKRTLAPLEIAELKKGKKASGTLCVEFSKASNRDGDLVAKFEIKTSTGGVPVELKPSLGQLLVPHTVDSAKEFDSTFAQLQGLQRASANLSLKPEMRDKLPTLILKDVAMSPLKNTKLAFDDNDQLRLVARLPATESKVYVLIECKKGAGSGTIVSCCEDAVVANSVLGMVKHAAIA